MVAYISNKKNNITPVTIKKSISKAFDGYISDQSVTEKKGKTTKDSILQIPKLEKEMLKAAEDLDFELAAKLRNKINAIKKFKPSKK